MSTRDTRSVLIGLIKEHQLENGLTKLGIEDLSMRAGITRQAFSRFYKDLKPFAQGQSIAQLLSDDPLSAKDFLTKREQETEELRQKILNLKIEHKKDLEQKIKKHITSLMKNDILAFEAKELSALLTSQSLHNEMLRQKVTQMELKQTRSVMESASAELASNSNSSKSAKNFLSIPLDLTKAYTDFNRDGDFDKFEDAKELELSKAVETIAKLPDHPNINVHLFQERYISSFEDFSNALATSPGKLEVAVRLPLYLQSDIGMILNKLRNVGSISIHIPHKRSEATAAANRKFLFRGVPEFEFKDADQAPTPQISWGFDAIHIFRIQ